MLIDVTKMTYPKLSTQKEGKAMTDALTTSTVEPVTPDYAESLGFVPSYTPGFYFVGEHGRRCYLEFDDCCLVRAVLVQPAKMTQRMPLPTRYNLARIVEEFTHKGNG